MSRLLVMLLVLGAVPCLGQDVGRAHGSVFIDLAGNAFIGFTANAEVFLAGPVGVRAGAGADIFSQTPVFPFQVVILLGGGRSKLELAGGVTVAQETYSGNWHWDGTKAFAGGFIGYRYQKPRGFLFHIGVVPLPWTNSHIPWPALGMGATF